MGENPWSNDRLCEEVQEGRVFSETSKQVSCGPISRRATWKCPHGLVVEADFQYPHIEGVEVVLQVIPAQADMCVAGQMANFLAWGIGRC